MSVPCEDCVRCGVTAADTFASCCTVCLEEARERCWASYQRMLAYVEGRKLWSWASLRARNDVPS